MLVLVLAIPRLCHCLRFVSELAVCLVLMLHLVLDLVLMLRYNGLTAQVLSFRKVLNLVKALCCGLGGFCALNQLAWDASMTTVEVVVDGALDRNLWRQRRA